MLRTIDNMAVDATSVLYNQEIEMAIQPWGKNSFRDRLITTLLFIGFGALTLIVFSPWRPLLEKTDDYLGRMILIVFLLITAYLFKRHERYQQYTKLTIGLIILAVAGSLDYIFAIYITRYLGLTDVAPMGWALQKLNEFAVVVSVVIFLNYATGDSLSSLYIKKGKLRMGLTIGFVLFFAAAAGSIPMANLFYGNDLTMERIIPWLPWILIFVDVQASSIVVSSNVIFERLAFESTAFCSNDRLQSMTSLGGS